MLCCPLDQTFMYPICAHDLIPILLCVIYLLYNQEGSKLYFCSQNFSTTLCVCNQQQKWQLNLRESRTLWGKHEQAMYCGIELLLIVIICFTSVGQYLLRLTHVCQKVFVVPQSCERVPTHEREPTPLFDGFVWCSTPGCSFVCKTTVQTNMFTLYMYLHKR